MKVSGLFFFAEPVLVSDWWKCLEQNNVFASLICVKLKWDGSKSQSSEFVCSGFCVPRCLGRLYQEAAGVITDWLTTSLRLGQNKTFQNAVSSNPETLHKKRQTRWNVRSFFVLSSDLKSSENHLEFILFFKTVHYMLSLPPSPPRVA